MSDGDPAKGVGAMEAVGDLVGAAGGVDDRADARGDLDRRSGSSAVGRRRGSASDHEDAPRPLVAGDRDRELAAAGRRVAEAADSRRPRRARVAGDAPDRRPGPSAPNERGRSGRRLVGAARARDEALAAELVDRGRPEAAALADDRTASRRTSSSVSGSAAIRPSAGHGREVGPAAEALAVGRGRARRRRLDRAAGGARRRWPDAAAEPDPRRSRRVLGRGEEALEVAEPVAPVAARVDPVVAQPAGVAPRPHRVRMHAEEAGGLRHREGGIDRAEWEARSAPGQLVEEMSSRRPEPTNLTVLANRTKVPGTTHGFGAGPVAQRQRRGPGQRRRMAASAARSGRRSAGAVSRT